MIKELQLLGLTKNESHVYQSLVKNGPCRAALIIKKINLHRNIVYQSLDSLTNKGYVTKVVKKGIWYFQITDPQSLLTGFKRKQNVLAEVIKEIQTYQNKTDQQIVVYEGIDSYRQYWIESLERVPSGTIDYAAGVLNNQEWIDLMGKSYQAYLNLRLKKRIYWKVLHFKITPSEVEMLKSYPDLTEYRLWPRNVQFKGNFNVFHDTIILQATTQPVRIIEIRDTDLVMVFQNYFDMLWEKAEPVKV